ncbi:triacylglycerol lipase [Massilia sp. Bi118]|uniref:esterase/lipase family protein n=1 Tax=Massilia sp. Bi118 TaxID=2822346 RepID=UPI001E3C6007|nr:alpha/beta fold hydrolase [Massilia sp. Bi118]
MTDPLRRLKDPVINEDGSLHVRTVLTPTSLKTRGLVYKGSNKVVPVIFIPGTMGTNLRVRRDISLPRGYPLKPGEPAWRPPNSDSAVLLYASDWKKRSPKMRQLILHPEYVEVDDSGDLDIGSCYLERSVMRERGWGEIFNGSYGTLLFELQSHLEMTFQFDALNKRHIRSRWKEVMQAMEGDTLKRWGVRSVAPLTETELEKYAEYQYPIYACGYNWLRSCGESANRLEERIGKIIDWWKKRNHECEKVILVTHSMGGLVARACAKRIPDKILGVIHGVMPALGTPLAYRRLACGTECDSPVNGKLDNFKAGKFADIAGRRPEDTTPVMSVAPGALELLPNQRYPRPWLHASVVHAPAHGERRETAIDCLHLPNESQPNPYDLYRDMSSWYRLINPDLANPANLYRDAKGGVVKKIREAINTAEIFHDWLGDYYHPTSFAYYGNDKGHPAYGQIRWVAQEATAGTKIPITAANIKAAKNVAQESNGARQVKIEDRITLSFSVEPQESAGDDTVSQQSGAAPNGKIKQLFATQGYRHQESYKHRDTILLTCYCIVKVVQELGKNG